MRSMCPLVPTPQADAIEERSQAAKEAAPLPDISAYLRPSGIMEARYVRLLSSLSALIYNLDKLTVRRRSSAPVTCDGWPAAILPQPCHSHQEA
jgi:hypothetical protein